MSNNRILAVDVGGGTQDILLYEENSLVENSVKLILPSQTRIIANRIAKITQEGKPIFLKGNLMGGGPCVGAIRNHISTGLEVFATELAAKTIHDNLTRVEKMGVKIVAEPPKEAVPVVMGDIDLNALEKTLFYFDIELPKKFAIAVQDHGECIDGSNRMFRFQHWKEFLQNDGEIYHLAYNNPPSYLTRMKAIKNDIPDAVVMDTGTAAIMGALCDPLIENENRNGVVIVNIGNQHTIGVLLKESRMKGLFEHHSGSMTTGKLKDYIHRLLNGTLTNEEVFEDGGHGCFIQPGFSLGNGFELISVTGPKRGLADGLGYYFAVPYGDMMLTGCFGLVKAAMDYLQKEL
ncbi:MAG: DUF1786 domain-containing protein [Pseudomonadota bacterium]